jgi:hypothetical protein
VRMSPTPSPYALSPYARAAAIAPYGFRRAELTRPRPAASTAAHRLRARLLCAGTAHSNQALARSAVECASGVCLSYVVLRSRC